MKVNRFLFMLIVMGATVPAASYARLESRSTAKTPRLPTSQGAINELPVSAKGAQVITPDGSSRKPIGVEAHSPVNPIATATHTRGSSIGGPVIARSGTLGGPAVFRSGSIGGPITTAIRHKF